MCDCAWMPQHSSLNHAGCGCDSLETSPTAAVSCPCSSPFPSTDAVAPCVPPMILGRRPLPGPPNPNRRLKFEALLAAFFAFGSLAKNDLGMALYTCNRWRWRQSAEKRNNLNAEYPPNDTRRPGQISTQRTRAYFSPPITSIALKSHMNLMIRFL